ncbi:hypothetical protein B0H17DRAFT_1217990 [Mycena rosella]|uniref:Uncharacterized protein n=1 Tax=Mycena rosella TaxID=1033263 RepID=A0AAD7FNI9_MYCRO|nr:hypothetical protein B0H17DRAFT_1217990 [Mycena rosella]
MVGAESAAGLPLLQWIPEVLHFCSTLPIFLVACKTDLRADPATPEQKTLTSVEGEAFAKQINTYRYVGCSAKSGEGVKEVFEQAMHAVLPQWRDHGQLWCCVVF